MNRKEFQQYLQETIKDYLPESYADASINDVSQLQFMVDKIKCYGYKNIGFILDRGYFSKDNLNYMDSSGFSFIIMVKGIKDFISSQVRKQKGTFENNWGNRIEEFEVYGKTVYTFVYASDTKEKAKKPNYLTVPAAIRELEKIEMTRQLDKVYRLDHAVTKTQKVILSAFGMDWNHLDNMLNTTYYNYKEEGAY